MTRLDRTSLRGVWGTVLLPLDDSDRIDVPRLQAGSPAPKPITSAPAALAAGSAAICSMTLPLTSTLEGAESAAFLPSKMRTF